MSCDHCKTQAQEIVRLLTVITSALVAMDDGRMGDVRRILKTGKAKPVTSSTSVIAGGGAA